MGKKRVCLERTWMANLLSEVCVGGGGREVVLRRGAKDRKARRQACISELWPRGLHSLYFIRSRPNVSM